MNNNHTLSYVLRWSSLESIAYQFLFTIHHTLLYYYCTPAVYGMSGLLFSLLFITTNLCNGGLDSLLAPNLNTWSASRQSCNLFLKTHVPITLFILLAAIVIGGIGWGLHHPSLWLTLSAILIIESARKSVRTGLRLIGYNRSVALIELATLLSYVTLCWIWYAAVGVFTIYGLLLPLLTTGIANLLFLLITAYQWYATLKKTCPTPPILLAQRLPLSVHQITTSLLSTNMLVVLCSLRMDIVEIGIIKLLSTFFQSVSLIMQKTFGPTIAYLFAHSSLCTIPSVRPSAHTIFAPAFTLLIMCLVVSTALALYCGIPFYHSVILCMILTVVNNYLLAYEQVYISLSTAHLLLLPNLLTLGIIIGLAHTSCSTSTLLIIFIGLRLITSIFLSIQALHRWQITPLWQLNK
jgi:hypothetical protein